MKIIGHRGVRGLAPENTLEALHKGLEHRVDGLEFDVRVSKDGVALLHHDPALTDQAGNRLLLKDHPFKELRAHKSDLATLEEALKIFGQRTSLFIEVKPDEPVEPIARVIKLYLSSSKGSRLYLASFSQSTLRDLHKLLPKLELVVIEKWSGIRAVLRAKELNTKILFMNKRWLWFGFIKSISRRGYSLYSYSLNDPRKAKFWSRYGLIGVITDYPDRFAK